MKSKTKRLILIAVCLAVVLWGTMFVTDCRRASSLQMPLFAVTSDATAQDGGSGTYRGLGYTVEVEVYLDAAYGRCVRAVELRMFGKTIAASIT